MKKTIKVETLVSKANAFFEHSPDDAKQDRLSVANFITNVLLEEKCYRGFGYLKDYYDPNNDSSRVFFYK